MRWAVQKQANVLDNVISELIQQQRRDIGSDVLGDKSNFFRGLNAFNDLLSGPSAILVDTDHSEVRGKTIQHGETWPRGALLEKLLHDLAMHVSTNHTLFQW